MEKTFQTGSFSFRLKFPEELVLPVDMEKFLVETDSVDYTYIITAVDILPEAEGELIVDRVDLQVFHTKEGLESRRIGVKGEARPYAFYRETAQNRAEVFVGRWYLAEVEKYEVVFLSLLASIMVNSIIPQVQKRSTMSTNIIKLYKIPRAQRQLNLL